MQLRAVFLSLALLTSTTHAAVGDVGVFTSEPRTFSTASYWIEGVDGVVLIDTQFLPKDVLRAADLAEKSTGKKVTTAIVLHPNPDKFNGTAALQARGVKVITSAQVAELIPAVHDIRWGWFGTEFAPDYPRVAAKPEVFGNATRTLTLAGVPITLHVLGKGASGAHLVAQHGPHVFVGDLVNPSNHAWLELGHIGDWLARLAEIRALSPSTVHPGRGQSAGPALLETQAAYLTRVRALVRERLQPGNLGWWTKWRLETTIEGEYPRLGFPIFMRDGLAAVWDDEQRNSRR